MTTPSQTAGPFLSIGTRWNADERIGSGSPDDAAIELIGTVVDGEGAPVTDAVLEFFQADRDGRFPPDTDPSWTGFTRSLTDSDGSFRLRTVKPGRVRSGDDCPAQAPHIEVSIFARGLLQRLVTRIYFADEEEANATDPVLRLAEEAGRRSRLVAELDAAGGYHFDLRLQGDDEGVFFVP